VAGPRIQNALGLTAVQWGWVGSLFAISYSLFEIPSGYLGDRIGARAVLSRIVLWWSGFSALTGIAWNYASLLVTRFLFGAGEAGAGPNMMLSVARWFPLTERVRALSIYADGGRGRDSADSADCNSHSDALRMAGSFFRAGVKRHCVGECVETLVLRLPQRIAANPRR